MKKLYMLGIAITLGITCMGCGNTSEVTDNSEAATETVAEATTETAAKVKTTKKQDKNKNTTEETLDVVENDTQPDKTQTGNQSRQRTTEAANRQTTGSASTQPTTQAPVSGQSTTQQPVTERPTPTQPTTERPTPPVQTCEHQWEEIMETIHHPPVIGTRCVQPAVMYYWYCRSCGCYYPTMEDDPCHGANGSDACYTAREAVFEDYEAVPAYDEQVGTGRYRCSRCGATK